MMRHSSGSRAPELVDAPEVRVQAVEPAQLALGRGDARIVVMVRALRRRRREHHLPAERRAVRRDPAPGGRAAASCPVRGRPVTKSGRRHRLLARCRDAACGPTPCAAGSTSRRMRVLARRDAAEQAEPRLVLVVGDQPPQRLAEARSPRSRRGRCAGAPPRGTARRRAARGGRPGALDAPDRQLRNARHECAHARLASRCRVRHRARARAASSCHAMSPGTPSTSSRTRLVSDSASAVSGPEPDHASEHHVPTLLHAERTRHRERAGAHRLPEALQHDRLREVDRMAEEPEREPDLARAEEPAREMPGARRARSSRRLAVEHRHRRIDRVAAGDQRVPATRARRRTSSCASAPNTPWRCAT